MKKRILALYFTITFCFAGVLAFAQNINLSNSPYWDGECYLAVNPQNPKHLVTAWMYFSITNLKNAMATRTSFDGGKTWTPIHLFPHVYTKFTCADPTIAFGKDSCIYVGYIDLSGLTTADSGYDMVSRSVDGGVTWSAPVKAIAWNAQPNLPIDRPWLAADKSSGKYSGRVYLTSQNAYFTPQPHHPWFTYSSDSGLTWAPIKQLDDSIPSGTITDAIAFNTVSADGAFYGDYVSYYTKYSVYPRLVVVKSFDGGATFTPYIAITYSVADGLPAADSLVKAGLCIASNPADSNNLVITTVTNHFGEPDVVSYNTHNAGQTWSGPVRVNDDLSGAYDTCHDLPWGSFSTNGSYGIAWRDRRHTKTSDTVGFQIFGAISKNGGDSYSPNFLISDTISPAILIDHGDDFMGSAITDSNFYADWSDMRTGKENTFFNATLLSSIPLSIFSVSDNPSVNVKAYPNPFHNETNVVISSAMLLKDCKLSIYSIDGKKVYEMPIPVNGTYKLNFSDFSSGTYIWSLTEQDKAVATGKWIVQ